MTLDPTQIMLLALLVSMGVDKVLILISFLRDNRAPQPVVITSPELTRAGPSSVAPGAVVIQPPVSPAPAEPAVVNLPVVAPPPPQPPVVVLPVITPGRPPIILAPTLPPPVVVPPLGIAIPRFTHITATSFAGANDSANSKTSAYTGREIVSSEPGFALPKHLAAADQHRRIRAFWGGKTVDGPVEDVGPWYDGRPGWPIDPYWETGTRPRAETDNRTNHAGIDLTPGAWTALGHPDPEGAKDYISWDWVDALGPVVPSVSGVPPTALQVAPSAPVAGGTVLQHNVWPPQSQAMSYFGNPASSGWEEANLVHVTCPWELTVEGTKSHAISINRKCADSLTRILNYIWEQCGKSQDKIHTFGYDVFDGSYNYRPIAGTSKLSEHAYGAALDFNAAANPQHAPIEQTKYKENSLIVQAFKGEGWTWGGDWSPAYIDAMHFQALRA